MITIMPSNPAYEGKPVILIHLAVYPNSGVGEVLAWCAPYTFIDPGTAYPSIPRVSCPACVKAYKNAE